jgi:hypothetical protein
VLLKGTELLLGWFLVAVEDYHQVFLNKPLAEKIALHSGVLFDWQKQIHEQSSFEHAVRDGLDQLDTGISILNKKGIALVENKAAREVSRKLGCRSAHLLPEVHKAIQKAKLGQPTEAFLNDFTVLASSWGSLNNGCVLQTRHCPARERGSLSTLDAWLKECKTLAKSLDLEITLAIEDGLQQIIEVPVDFRIESLCQFLLEGDISKRVVVSCEKSGRFIQLHFDQEFCEGSKSQPETLAPPPDGIGVFYASLGRRLVIEMPLGDKAINLVLCNKA